VSFDKYETVSGSGRRGRADLENATNREKQKSRVFGRKNCADEACVFATDRAVVSETATNLTTKKRTDGADGGFFF